MQALLNRNNIYTEFFLQAFTDKSGMWHKKAINKNNDIIKRKLGYEVKKNNGKFKKEPRQHCLMQT